MPLYLIQYKEKGLFRKEGVDTRAYLGGNHRSEFENLKNVKRCIFRSLKQAGTKWPELLFSQFWSILREFFLQMLAREIFEQTYIAGWSFHQACIFIPFLSKH